VSDFGPNSLASLDGEIMPASEAVIPVTDEGLIRGDGAFEVIRVYNGVPYAIDAHFARLARTGTNIRLPIDLEAVRADSYRLLAQAGTGEDAQLLRIMITRGGRRILLTEQMPPLPEEARLMSVTYSPTRLLDGAKTLSYAANMLAGRLAKEQGYDEALLVTPHGRVLEAPTSSIFYVTDGELFTPPLDEHILASITRALVIAVSGAVERICTLEQLKAADEVFLASTVREVMAVSAIDDQRFGDRRPISERIAKLAAERIQAELAAV
jgi:branched-chain amino acid aminotransferase